MKNFTIAIEQTNEAGRYNFEFTEAHFDNPLRVVKYLRTLEDMDYRKFVNDFTEFVKLNKVGLVEFNHGYVKVNKPACPTDFHKALLDDIRTQMS